MSEKARARGGRVRSRAAGGVAIPAATLAVVLSSASALAQSEPARGSPASSAASTATIDPEASPPSRATRVALGASAALGMTVLTMGIPLGIGGALSAGSATPITVGITVGAAMALATAPFGYVLAGDATGGRGQYWPALLGWIGGVTLGSIALPIQLAVSPFTNNIGLIIAVGVLSPLLGLTGMAIGYELSHDNARATQAPLASARRPALRWAPSLAFDGRAALLTIGATL